MPPASFDLVIHRRGGNLYAAIPALPGCVAEGATLAELLHNAREAILEHHRVRGPRSEERFFGIYGLEVDLPDLTG